jgi:predicted acylesterase/phospholipase RssA
VVVQIPDSTEVKCDLFFAIFGIGALIKNFAAKGQVLGKIALQFAARAPEVLVVIPRIMPPSAAAVGGPFAEALLKPNRQEELRLAVAQPALFVAGGQLHQWEDGGLREMIRLMEEPELGAQLGVSVTKMRGFIPGSVERERRDDVQLQVGQRAVVHLDRRRGGGVSGVLMSKLPGEVNFPVLIGHGFGIIGNKRRTSPEHGAESHPYAARGQANRGSHEDIHSDSSRGFLLRGLARFKPSDDSMRGLPGAAARKAGRFCNQEHSSVESSAMINDVLHLWRGIACMLLSVLAAGCTYANKPLNAQNVPLERRIKNHTRAALAAEFQPLQSATEPTVVPTTDPSQPPIVDRDGYFVGVAISGGGSRSAVFSAACMFQLQRLGLLQRVDYISAVSGGSLTAAFYCLNGPDRWNPGSAQRKLTHSFASDIIFQIIQPWIYLTTLLTDYDRSDLLANSLRKNLFTVNGHEQTFADLRADRPHLLLNATDLQSGKAFVFCNESFDELNSDLSKYPIAYAVAASAAVPVVMHQVTLRDFSTVFKQYQHLIDGGINDNLGISSLVETYDAQVKSARHAGRPTPYPHGAIFFVLDARTQFDVQLSDKGDTNLLQSMETSAGLTSTALLNRASSATLSDLIVKYSPDNVTARDLRADIQRLTSEGMVDLQDQDHRPVRVVHVALSNVGQLQNVPFHSFGTRVNSIATYFDIEPTEAYQLIRAADLLIQQKFQHRLEEISRDLKVAAPPGG